MAHVSMVEKLRRAIAATRRTGSAASTAAWRARRKLEEARQLAADLARTNSGAPAKFADTETDRLQVADLAELMHAKAKE
jgi:hypothetical protein